MSGREFAKAWGVSVAALGVFCSAVTGDPTPLAAGALLALVALILYFASEDRW